MMISLPFVIALGGGIYSVRSISATVRPVQTDVKSARLDEIAMGPGNVTRKRPERRRLVAGHQEGHPSPFLRRPVGFAVNEKATEQMRRQHFLYRPPSPKATGHDMIRHRASWPPSLPVIWQAVTATIEQRARSLLLAQA